MGEGRDRKKREREREREREEADTPSKMSVFASQVRGFLLKVL